MKNVFNATKYTLYDLIESCYKKYADGQSFEDYVEEFMSANFFTDWNCGHELFGTVDENEYLGSNFVYRYKLDIDNRQIIFPIIIDVDEILKN